MADTVLHVRGSDGPVEGSFLACLEQRLLHPSTPKEMSRAKYPLFLLFIVLLFNLTSSSNLLSTNM